MQLIKLMESKFDRYFPSRAKNSEEAQIRAKHPRSTAESLNEEAAQPTWAAPALASGTHVFTGQLNESPAPCERRMHGRWARSAHVSISNLLTVNEQL